MAIGRNTLQPVLDAPILQYAGGRTVARRPDTSGKFTGKFGYHIGFHVERGRDEELDRAMAKAEVPLLEIKHQRQGGAEVVVHWDLTFGKDEGWQLGIFPITSGPVAADVRGSLRGRNRQATIAAGIGIRWADGEKSKVGLRLFVLPLVKAGYLKPLQLSVRSNMSDVLLRELCDHGRVCTKADNIVDRAQHPEVVAFHEVLLPLGPATEEQTWGKGSDTTQMVPFKSLHAPTEQIQGSYFKGRWRPEALHVEAERIFPDIQAWAEEFSETADEPNGRRAEEVL